MKKFFLILILVIIVALAAFLIMHQTKTATFRQLPDNSQPNSLALMKIQSSAFSQNQNLPKKYTCDDAGINPPLSFSNVPTAAQSLALMMDDPDAPMGTWHHWLVWNIDPHAAGIAENSTPPKAVVGVGSNGQNNYGAACPPPGSGPHRYIFKLFALDSKLDLPSYSQAADLQEAMNGHIIAQDQLVGLYGRPK